MANYTTPKILYNAPRSRLELGVLTYDLTYVFTAASQTYADKIQKEYAEKTSFSELDVGSRKLYPKSVTVDHIGGNQYMMYVTATVGDSTGDQNNNPRTKTDFARWCSKDMTQKECRWMPEWWGIEKADKINAGITPYKTYMSSVLNQYEYDFYKYGKNIKNTNIYEGDYIYRNATYGEKIVIINKSTSPPTLSAPIYAGSTPTIGEPITTLSPYLTTSGEPLTHTQALSKCGHPFKVDVYRVSFYTRHKFNDIAPFRGVSPEGESAFGDTSARKLSPYYIGDAKWMAIDQNFSYTTDIDGDNWIKITRTMECAPNGFKWDVNRNVYGYWDWGNH